MPLHLQHHHIDCHDWLRSSLDQVLPFVPFSSLTTLVMISFLLPLLSPLMHCEDFHHATISTMMRSSLTDSPTSLPHHRSLHLATLSISVKVSSPLALFRPSLNSNFVAATTLSVSLLTLSFVKRIDYTLRKN